MEVITILGHSPVDSRKIAAALRDLGEGAEWFLVDESFLATSSRRDLYREQVVKAEKSYDKFRPKAWNFKNKR